MLKYRIIPIILFDGSYCVQTTQFKRPARRIGPISQYVNNIAKRNVDELIIIDINATKEKRKPYFDKIKEFTSNQFCPVTYGGGISTIQDIETLIRDCGVDKVAVKTSFSIIHSAAKKFGSQAIVYAMDTTFNNKKLKIDGMLTYSKLCPYKWAKTVQEEGAGEIILTHINNQGTLSGYCNSLIKDISSSVKIPVIANGGCGEEKHMIEAIKCGASAAAASTMFCLRETTPQDCSRALHAAGYPARLEAQNASQRLA